MKSSYLKYYVALDLKAESRTLLVNIIIANTNLTKLRYLSANKYLINSSENLKKRSSSTKITRKTKRFFFLKI